MTTAIKINSNDGVTRNVMTGGETTIDFDFPIFDAEHLEVYETNAVGVISLLVKDTDYTVPAGSVNQQAGGTINLDPGVYPSGATATHIFTVHQAAPEERTTDFNQAGDFIADTLNKELDLITQQIQQLRRDLNRSLLSPVDTTLTGFSFPDPEDGSVLAWEGTDGTLQNTSLATLSESLDVLLSGLSVNDYLRYNGLFWVNRTTSETRTDLDVYSTTEVDNLIGSAPTIQKFTSVSSGTYVTPANVRYIQVIMVGGGGGGAGASGGGSPGSNGGDGGDTTFGGSLLIATGGEGGRYAASGGQRGSATIGAGAAGTALSGEDGESATAVPILPGNGGASYLGGASKVSAIGVNPQIPGSNSGSGGAGGRDVFACGAGGGAGGYIDAIISSPAATYAFTIGGIGSGGDGNPSLVGANGAAGALGYLEVREFYI